MQPNDPIVSRTSRGGTRVDIDQGLRSHMLRVYAYMTGALGLTGLFAILVAGQPSIFNAIWGSGLGWVVALAPLGFVFFLSFRIHKISFQTAQAVFWIYAAVMGVSLSALFMAYTGESIARAFFITSGTFGAMSLYGYTTKKDLTSLGSFLFMGLIGIILASIGNIFIKSSGLSFAVSVLAVLIFTGLTAYDTQKIKEFYLESDSNEVAGKKAIMGALALYLDFINIMIHLLRLIGDRR